MFVWYAFISQISLFGSEIAITKIQLESRELNAVLFLILSLIGIIGFSVTTILSIFFNLSLFWSLFFITGIFKSYALSKEKYNRNYSKLILAQLVSFIVIYIIFDFQEYDDLKTLLLLSLFVGDIIYIILFSREIYNLSITKKDLPYIYPYLSQFSYKSVANVSTGFLNSSSRSLISTKISPKSLSDFEGSYLLTLGYTSLSIQYLANTFFYNLGKKTLSELLGNIFFVVVVTGLYYITLYVFREEIWGFLYSGNIDSHALSILMFSGMLRLVVSITDYVIIYKIGIKFQAILQFCDMLILLIGVACFVPLIEPYYVYLYWYMVLLLSKVLIVSYKLWTY